MGMRGASGPTLLEGLVRPWPRPLRGILKGGGVGSELVSLLDCLPPVFFQLRITVSLYRLLVPCAQLSLLTTFSDGCLGSNNDEGRSEV